MGAGAGTAGRGAGATAGALVAGPAVGRTGAAVQTLNFDGLPEAKPVRLPDRSSIRVRLETGYRPNADGTTGYDAEIELGNGKRIVLQKGGFIVPTPTAAMESWAKGAGFARVERYGGYDKEPFSPKSENVLMLFR